MKLGSATPGQRLRDELFIYFFNFELEIEKYSVQNILLFKMCVLQGENIWKQWPFWVNKRNQNVIKVRNL